MIPSTRKLMPNLDPAIRRMMALSMREMRRKGLIQSAHERHEMKKMLETVKNQPHLSSLPTDL